MNDYRSQLLAMDSPASEPPQTDSSNTLDGSRTSEGHLPVPEGTLYWKLDTSEEGQQSGRPTFLLVHSAVSDHTAWDAQVDFLVSKGWNCLRSDLFGYGVSQSPEPLGDRSSCIFMG